MGFGGCTENSGNHSLRNYLLRPSLQEVEFMKEGNLSLEELDAFISVLQLAGNKLVERNPLERKPKGETEQPQSVDKSISSLEAMGVKVYGLDEPIGISNSEISWDIIAGYEHQKRYVNICTFGNSVSTLRLAQCSIASRKKMLFTKILNFCYVIPGMQVDLVGIGSVYKTK